MMPHNGALITLLAICGLTHRDSYKDLFVVGLIVPTFTLIFAIVLHTMFGLFLSKKYATPICESTIIILLHSEILSRELLYESEHYDSIGFTSVAEGSGESIKITSSAINIVSYFSKYSSGPRGLCC